ncbi:MAG: phospholipid-binding protein MlaC [Desulfotignum sp.]|nr:ABC transporter substrate-binding protein [Desulfobacteraceae bacterium]
MKLSAFLGPIVIICHICLPGAMAEAPSARKQLEYTIDKVTNILAELTSEKDTDKKEQMALLCDAVYERFSLAKTARLCLMDHWGKRTDVEKEAFIALFGKFLENAYLSKADRYQGEQVVFVREKIDHDRAQVHVRVLHGVLVIPATVKMHLTRGGQWMVYDVTSFGISLVGNYRAQFNHIIKRHSYEKVIQIMEEKTNSHTGCRSSYHKIEHGDMDHPVLPLCSLTSRSRSCFNEADNPIL